jgi:large subunit ribosomal protein L4
MNLTKLTATGTKSTIAVSDVIFGAPVNQQLLAQAVRVYMSNKRQGTSKAQTRSEVSRTTAKWFKQKGTGRARHGARSAPQFVGGGVAHGPNGEQNWKLALPKRMKIQALVSALSAQSANMFVSDAVQELTGKTKEAAQLLQHVRVPKDKILVVLANAKPEVMRSLRNLEKVLVTSVSRVNALEVAMADKIILSTQALKALETRLSEPTAEVKPVVEKAAPKVAAKPAVEKTAKKPAAPKKAAKPAVKKTPTKKTAK